MKLRDLKNGKVKFKMHGKYPAVYIASNKKKKHIFKRRKGGKHRENE